MRAGLVIAARAGAQLVLVAASSVTLAAYASTGHGVHLGLGTAISFGISWVWWSNSRAAAFTNVAHGQWWYAAGAASGTLIGAVLARMILQL